MGWESCWERERDEAGVPERMVLKLGGVSELRSS